MQNLKFIFYIAFVFFLSSSCTTNDGYLYKIFKDGKYGFIDSLGTEIIKPQYIMAVGFNDGLALVVTDTNIILPKPFVFKSKIESSFFNSIASDTLIEFKYGYINTKNKMVIEPIFTYRSKFSKFSSSNFNQNDFDLDQFSFNDNLALFRDSANNYGFIDKKGNIVVNPIYKRAKNFSDGLAAICVYDSLNFIEKWGYIDVKGHIVIEPKYNNALDFTDGLAFVFLRGPGFTKALSENPDGNIPLDFYWMLINKSAKIIGKPLSAVLSTPYGFCDSISIVETKFFFNHIGFKFMDINGNYTTDFDIEDVTHYGDGFAGVKSKDGWLFVDKNMKIKSKYYDNVKRFNDGYAPVKIDGLWGYIDTTFNNVIDCRFDTCSYFLKGLAKVRMKSQTLIIEGFINKKGNVVWQNEYYDNN